MSILRICLATVVLGILLLGRGAGSGEAWAQPDSTRAEILEARGYSPDHSPKGALWRSAAVPGWGQYYNRHYYKIPLVYAGLAGIGVLIYRAQDRYLLFDRAHLFGLGEQEEGENPYSQYEEQYTEVKERVFQGGTVRLAELRNQRDRFRRRRDLAILGTGLFYAFTLMDAYVSAHLLTFDVGEDLEARVRPTGTLETGSATAARRSSSFHGHVPPDRHAFSSGLGMRVRLRF